MIWSHVYNTSGEFGDVTIYEHGYWFWISAGYQYALIFIGTVILLRFGFTYRAYRKQAVALTTGVIIPILGNLLYLLFNSIFLGGLDPTPIALALSQLIYTLTIYRYGFLDLGIVARRVSFNSILDGILVLNATGNIADINRAGETLTGFPKDRVIGRQVEDIWPELARYILNIEDRQTGTLLCTQYGRTLYLNDSLTIIPDSKGAVGGKLIVIHDDTPRTLAEIKLKESEQKYRSLVENIHDILFTLDTAGNITYISPVVERAIHYKAADLTGWPFAPLVHPEDLPGLLDSLNRLMGGEMEPWEFRVRDRDGSIVWVRSSSRPMYTDGQVTGITGILSNITQRKIAELKLQKQTYDLNERVKELNSLHLLSRLIDNKGDSAVDFFQAAVELLPPAMQYPEIACVRLTVEGREYDTAKWCESPLKRAADIIAGGTKVGSLEVRYLTDLTGNPEITFLDEERALIDSFAGRLGHLIYRWQLEGRLVRSAEQWKNATEGIVMAMASLLESRDFYTATHQRRVAKLAVAIAEDMQMEEDRVTGLRLAANVHDIGKISIPMEILNKSGKLSEAEYTIIKTHAEIGYLLLKPIGFPQPVAQIVYQHHERMDGSGYPQKLQGRDILPEARILSVAEVVQAMVSHRSYRRAHGIDKALEEIMRGSGVIYDADVVNSCVRLFGRGGFSF